MANPRKFSEKIALHNQKQAEETAAFEAIMKEVNNATRTVVYAKQHLPISQSLGAYRGGSLPNVNQIGANQGIDLQTALQHLEDIKQGRPNIADRIHRDRSRQIGPHRSRPFPIDKRVDCSPYGSAYLSPPPDTSWRRMYRYLNGVSLARTNSDSALHTSTMGPGATNEYNTHPATTPPTHRRIMEMVGEDSPESVLKGYWGDPKKLPSSRPKSCEVPNINWEQFYDIDAQVDIIQKMDLINIYPSQEQDLGQHIPISNNTGSLPDLTVLHFPSPLTTPLDAEDGGAGGYGGTSSPSSLSPTSPHHMAMPPPANPQSPATRRRHVQGVPSPLVLNNANQMRVPLSPPVDPSSVQLDPRIAQQYLLHMQQQRQRSPLAQSHQHLHNHHHHQQQQHHHPHQLPLHQHHHSGSTAKPSTQLNCTTTAMTSSSGVGVGAGSAGTSKTQPVQGGGGGQVGSLQLVQTSHGLPHVHITSCDPSDVQPSMTQYRNSVSDVGCQSPTSPHSAPSFSPAQSPGLPPTSSINSSPFAEAYYVQQQQQQQTSALQHQFEQFNMENPISTAESQMVLNNGLMSPSHHLSNNPALNFSQAVMHGLGSSIDFQQQQTQQQQQQQQQPPNFFHTHDMQLSGMSQIGLMGMGTSGMSGQHQHTASVHNKIPDIVLTGADDPFGRTPLDFAKELGNAITGMPDGFDTDFLSNDEAFKADLGPLDFDGLQMLTDPNMVTDPATEDTFKLDRL